MKELVLPIKGMHCRSCEIMIGQNLEELPDVKKADVNLKTKTATVYAKHLPPQHVLRRAIQSAGYDIGYDSNPLISRKLSDYSNVLYGVVIVILAAVILKETNLASLGAFNISGKANGVVALLVGLTAGLSTCMALVGGLVLGLSARHAEKHPSATTMQKFRPHLFFNISRIASFFILGGLIGLMGSVFSIKGSLLGILTILVGVVMFVLGLQLTEIFPRLSNGGLTLPAGLAKALGIKKRGDKEYSHKNAATLGTLSFFLPCGFTQAMQLLAISTGSFISGALIMGLFAIGTAPGLLGVGGLTSVVKGASARRFFKIAGVVVVAMAVYNINTGYTLTGWPKPFAAAAQFADRIPPKFTPTPLTGDVEQPEPVDSTPSDRVLKTSYWLNSDIVPSTFTVYANETYALEVDAKETGVGCMSTIMIPGLNNDPQYLVKGKTNKLTFKAKRRGTYQITCAMGVPRGTIKVI